MLILTRRIGESLIIGGDIKVTVLGMNASRQLRLGIEAPKHINVDREEIHERRMAEPNYVKREKNEKT